MEKDNDDEDDLNFEHDESLHVGRSSMQMAVFRTSISSQNSIGSISSQNSTNTMSSSSLLNGRNNKQYRTKSQRRRMRLAHALSNDNDDDKYEKTVRFSLSPNSKDSFLQSPASVASSTTTTTTTTTTSRRRRRKKATVPSSSTSSSSSSSSSICQYLDEDDAASSLGSGPSASSASPNDRAVSSLQTASSSSFSHAAQSQSPPPAFSQEDSLQSSIGSTSQSQESIVSGGSRNNSCSNRSPPSLLRTSLPARQGRRPRSYLARFSQEESALSQPACSSSQESTATTASHRSSCSSSSSTVQSLQQQQQQKSGVLVASSLDGKVNNVFGAGIGVLAVQDAGSYRMLFDDVSYLCSTICLGAASSLSSSSFSGNNVRQHYASSSSSAHEGEPTSCALAATVGGAAIEAACDLALLLANVKTRAVLLKASSSSSHEECAALTAILETLSVLKKQPPPPVIQLDKMILGARTTTTPRTEEEYDMYCGGGDVGHSNSSSTMLSPSAGNNNGKQILVGVADDDKPAQPTTQTKTARKRRALETKQQKVNHLGAAAVERDRTRNQLAPPLHEALAAVIHFLSWDCTKTEHSSLNNASRARQVRTAMLQHPFALRSACHLALMDPVVEHILSKVQNPNGTSSGPVDEKRIRVPCRIVGGEQRPCHDVEKGDEDGDDAASRASSIDTRESQSSASHHGGLSAAGRKKRRTKRRMQVGKKKAKLDVIVEDQEFALLDSPVKPPAQVKMQLSFASDDGSLGSQKQCKDDASVSSAASVQVLDKLVQLRSAVVQPDAGDDEDCTARASNNHTCEFRTNGLPGDSTKSNLLERGDFMLKSICRIVEGKDGEEDSCIENDAKEGGAGVERPSQGPLNEQDEEDDEEQLRRNPLLITNTLLRKGGILPVLSRAMAETLSSLIVVLTHSLATSCAGCMLHLKQRVSLLAALIDGACCLTCENRQELCGDGSQLMSSILLFLRMFSNMTPHSPFEGGLLDEIALLSLRTLTSLTHDNDIARELLVMSYNVVTMTSSAPLSGVLILADLLWKTVTCCKTSQLQSAYDVVIFCLNTLSNTVEAENLRQMLADHKVPVSARLNGKPAVSVNEEPFLTWLSRWLFLETTPFREAVIRGSFGQKEKQGAIHDLEKNDEENLITAGNGFILLACLMRQSKLLFDVDEQLFVRIRRTILKELQADSNGDGLLLIKNTLKAFCNFYHYSLGDLSVAIVGPVGLLIAELDGMESANGNTEKLS